MSTNKVTLSAENIHYGYTAKQEVLHGMSFQAREGDLLFLLGPNGSGKTTLFKCLMGIYKPSSGAVTIEGENIHGMSSTALARKMAYIPQAHNPSFNYTVLDVVLMGRTAYLKGNSSPKEQDVKIALDSLEKLNILYLKDKGYAHISGGERQMVLIARALTQQSRIIVMDEPTSSLDYGHQVNVLTIVQKLAKEGYTIIVSSHNPEHAFLYANQVLLMKHGQVIVHGDPYQVVNREILEKVYEVPMDILNIQRNSDGCIHDYRVCVPIL